MTRPVLKLFSVTFALLTMAGCSSSATESEDVESDNIWAGISIVSVDGRRSVARVELNVDGHNGNDISLSNGDSLEAVTSDGSVNLERDDDVLDVNYQGNLPVGESGETIRVNFRRSASADITGSRVSLPETFNIRFPQDNMTFTSLQDIEILWSAGNSDEKVQLHQTAVCKNRQNQDVRVSETLEVADDGRYTTDFLSREVTAILDRNGCDFTISIDRTWDGNLATGFGAGGFIRASQRREIKGMRLTL